MQDTAGSGFNFTASGSSATITGIGTHTNGGVLVIPPTVMYGGTTYNVTTIGDLSRTAFSGELTFPSSVTSIGHYAFYGCGNLQTVTIPATVTWIGDAAFGDCWGVVNVYFMGNATWPKSIYRQFNPFAPTKVYVKAGAGTETGWFGGNPQAYYAGVFGENYLINSIAITYPTSTYISKGSALSYSTFIDGSAAVPGTFTWESPTTICNVAANHNVKFTPNNPQLQALGYTKVVPVAVSVYNTISGVKYLYSGSTATVIGYDSALSATLIIPSTFTDYTVTAIDASAFADCTVLTSVTIPASVTAIGASAFAGCSGLANAYFLGNAITDNIPFTSQLPQIYVKSVATEWGTTFSGCNVTQVKISTVPISTAYTENQPFVDGSLSGGSATVDGTFSWASETFTVAALYSVEFTPDNLQLRDLGYSFYVDIEVNKLLPTTTDGVTASISSSGNATVISVPVINGAATFPAEIAGYPVTEVAQGAISDEAKVALTDLNVPEGIKTLGSKLCQGCPNLANFTLPTTIEFIGDYVFAGCPTLRNGAVPDGASVGNYTFSGCIGLV